MYLRETFLLFFWFHTGLISSNIISLFIYKNLSDNDCQGGLVCFQRNYDESVPGCADNPDAANSWDYVSSTMYLA